MLGQYFYDTKEHFYVKKNRFFENLESKSPLNGYSAYYTILDICVYIFVYKK